MLRKPARILAIVVGLAMLAVESGYATRFDPGLANQPSPASGPTVRLPGEVLPALKKATLVKSPPNAGKRPITLTFVLKRDHQKAFERFLHELYDPHSTNYHHFLTQAEIASRFGPSQKSYDAVLAYLERYGFKLAQGSKNRMTLTVRGTRAMAEHAFKVKIHDYQIGDANFYANDGEPGLPARAAASVQAVIGLTNLMRPRSPRISRAGGHAPALRSRLLVHANQARAFPEPPRPHPITAINNLIIELACKILSQTQCQEAQNRWKECFALNPHCGGAVDSPDCCTKGWTAPNSSPACPSVTAGYHEDGSDQAYKKCLTNFNYQGTPPTDPAPYLSDGTGQTIGLVEFSGFNPSDVSNFINFLGLNPSQFNNLSIKRINGGAAISADEDEVLLDIEWVMLAAPGAKVVVYEAPFAGAGGSFQPIINQMINDKVSIISNSWAYCEDQTTQADVDSIDSLFTEAAAAGISVFNGAGDNGSTCLDGSKNTVAVPADSPNATAVGGSSLTRNPDPTQETETWWDGATATPQTGRGGFGISKYFAVPAYQAGLATGGRSVPDVVAAADPGLDGLPICEADNGGCPNGLSYGGTSAAAPMWAAFAALLNQSQGKNLGFLNPLLYPLAGTNAFHGPAALSTDFAHVGLGSPDLDQIYLQLSDVSVGPPSASLSTVGASYNVASRLPPVLSANGTDQAIFTVTLRDSLGNVVSGKTVDASIGGSAQITPASAITDSDGVVVFTATDLTAEDAEFTATDASDGLNLTSGVAFAVPPAASGNVVANLSTNPADGTTADTITVTLQDSLGRPTPGKLVTLSQGNGHSAVTAPSPDVTDSNGQAQFQVTDLVVENVTYDATDVTDSNLPVPGSAAVDFTSGLGGCATSQPGNVVGTVNTANGFKATTVASGFFVSNGNQGFSYNCFGAWGMAWDASDNMYVTDWPTGKIYKFDSSGGVADAAHLFTSVKAPASGVAIDPAGNMFASEASVSGANGDIVPVDLSTGAVGTAIASGIGCLGSMALDPTTPALFAIDFCNVGQGGSDNIWQVTGIDGPSPSTSVYAQVPSSNTENLQITVAPDGTLYDLFCANGPGCEIERVSTAAPPASSTLMTANGTPITLFGSLGITPAGMQPGGDAQFVIFPQPAQDGLGQGIQTIDLTGPAAAPAVQITKSFSSGLSNFAVGPDGCLYIAGGPVVTKITNTDGTCSFAPQVQPPTLSLTPTIVSPNPTQGGSQNLTASLHGASISAGTPVLLQVTGANPSSSMVRADANGQASFSYTGVFAGTDNMVATATVNSTAITSNPVQVTWNTGQDTTFLTLNMSPKTGTQGQPVTVVASLSDISQNPAVAVAGEPVSFTLGTDSCSASTDVNGNVSCTMTVTGSAGTEALTASFAGHGNLNPSTGSAGFTIAPCPPASLWNPIQTTRCFSMPPRLGNTAARPATSTGTTTAAPSGKTAAPSAQPGGGWNRRWRRFERQFDHPALFDSGAVPLQPRAGAGASQ